MTILNTWFGPLQLYKSVPWAKGSKVFTIRKPPGWAVTGAAASKLQEIQWVHMVLVAHQGKYMKGKMTYTNEDGKEMSISAPAALVGILRRRTTNIAAGDPKDKLLVSAAAEIMARFALVKGADGKLSLKFPPLEVGGKKLPNIAAAAEFITTQIPHAPVMTKEEEEATFERKHLSKDNYVKYLQKWEELTGTMLKESAPGIKQPVYPAGKGKSIFDDFF